MLKRLASGGMGDVYLVRHRHLQELRVVKVLRADLAADEAVMQRFQQEARVATQIKHANVAILYDYSRLPDGHYYMVWEYIEGEDLGHSIRRLGHLPVDLAVELAIQALRGLDAIHGAGVIHRDVSPDNLMVTEDVRGRALVKIIDLGLAKDLRPGQDMELTQAGAFLGKFQYCSPEQAGSVKAQPLDARSDLYSLAQVLYEALTGMPPFDSESQHGFVLKRLTEEPVPLTRRNPRLELPQALEAVVMRGLERDRERRYPDAASFIAALAKIRERLRDHSTQELAVPPPPPPSRLPAPAAGVETGRTAPRTPTSPSLALSREERDALLARIDRAASRVRETSKVYTEAESALRDGRFEEARDHLSELEKTNPRLKGLPELRQRLSEAEGIARRRQQVMQAEQMLEKYLLERQQTLAGLALEALLDLYPNHPKRSDYESWVGLLAEEAAQQKRAEAAFAEGRAAVARGDFEAARRQLEIVEEKDLTSRLAGTLLREIQEADRGRRLGAQAADVRDRFEEHLTSGDVAAAAADLEALASLEVTRVTLDTFRTRLEETEERQRREGLAAGFETTYRDAVARHDWFAARDAARQMGEALPDSRRPQQMFREISRLQEVEQRQQAIAGGLAAFDGYLGAGDVGQAEVALRVLRQLAPDDPAVVDAGRRLERQK